MFLCRNFGFKEHGTPSHAYDVSETGHNAGAKAAEQKKGAHAVKQILCVKCLLIHLFERHDVHLFATYL